MRDTLRRVIKRSILATPQGRNLQARLRSLEQELDAALAQRDAMAADTRDMRGHLDRLTLQLQELSLARDAAVREVAQAQLQLEEQRRLYGEGPPFVPNGHFYSPIAAKEDMRREAATLFPDVPPRSIAGLDLRPDAQLHLLEQLGKVCADQPFTDDPEGGRRYGFNNPAYSYTDALCLHGMLRLLKPKRLVEIGSGHSSCATLDTRELFLDGKMQCTFIEPYPQLLHSLLKPTDLETIRILPERVQDVDLGVFRELEAGDILFIDSTHVSKIGSDVNRLYFDVLPTLAPGVHVHIHDIFYPFEYPAAWVMDEGRAWNEQYLLRALLQESRGFEIELFTTYLARCHWDAFVRALPLGRKNPGGSLWLKRL